MLSSSPSSSPRSRTTTLVLLMHEDENMISNNENAIVFLEQRSGNIIKSFSPAQDLDRLTAQLSTARDAWRLQKKRTANAPRPIAKRKPAGHDGIASGMRIEVGKRTKAAKAAAKAGKAAAKAEAKAAAKRRAEELGEDLRESVEGGGFERLLEGFVTKS